MQNTASLPPDRFDDLLRRLPAHLDLDALARQTKAIERNREIDSGLQIMRLALARGPGGLSLAQTAAWATMLGMAEISDPAVKYRLDKAVEFLDAVVACQLADQAPGAAVRWAGRTLRDADGSCFRERGSKTTDWRLHAVYDLGRGGFSHLELTDKHGAEGIERGAPIPGEIRLGDRNFGRAANLRRFRQQSDNQADFIVRAGWNAFSLIRLDGSAFDLISHLGTLPADMTPHEMMLCARVGVLDPPPAFAWGKLLPLRLIIRRKTPEATEATRETLRREASRKQKVLDPRSLVAAEFVILVTSLPAEGYPAEEVLAVYRLRWQIELAFKRLKSLLRMDRLPTHTPRASRSWLLAHLIMALLCDDLSQEFLESSP
jgi:Transposase DDE domain